MYSIMIGIQCTGAARSSFWIQMAPKRINGAIDCLPRDLVSGWHLQGNLEEIPHLVLTITMTLMMPLPLLTSVPYNCQLGSGQLNVRKFESCKMVRQSRAATEGGPPNMTTRFQPFTAPSSLLYSTPNPTMPLRLNLWIRHPARPVRGFLSSNTIARSMDDLYQHPRKASNVTSYMSMC